MKTKLVVIEVKSRYGQGADKDYKASIYKSRKNRRVLIGSEIERESSHKLILDDANSSIKIASLKRCDVFRISVIEVAWWFLDISILRLFLICYVFFVTPLLIYSAILDCISPHIGRINEIVSVHP